jgi:hypothetical protein
MKTTLDEEQVRLLFKTCSKECDALLGLFRMVISDWDRVEYILEGTPSMGEEGWHEIYDLFRKFNDAHPGENVFPGGLWLGMGFSVDKTLGPWEVDTSKVKLIYKPDSK